MVQMMMKATLVLFAAVGLVTLAGCAGSGNGKSTGGDMLAQPVEIVSQVHGDKAVLDMPMVSLIDSAEAYESLFAGEVPVDVDFASQQAIVLALGQQPTGGYWISADAVQRVGNTLYVQATANRPGPDAMTTQALTYPFAVAVIPSQGNVTLVSDVVSVAGQAMPK